MKNHKGLVAHKRTCVKKQSKNIQETNIEIKQNNEVFDLNNLNETS